MKRLPKALLVGAATILLLGLGACSSEPAPQADKEPTTAPAPPSPTEKPMDSAPSGDAFTALVVEIAWEQATEKDKDELCTGIALFGAEYAADTMRTGAAGDESTEDVDWDQVARTFEEKCEAR